MKRERKRKRDEKRSEKGVRERERATFHYEDLQCERESANHPRFVLTIVNRTNGECYVTLGDR